MGRYLYLGLAVALALVLCACAGLIPEPTEVPETTCTEPSLAATTAPTTQPVTETTQAETEAALHSALYLPAYTTQQVQAFFREVALDMEYTDGIGDVTLIQKWTSPILYQFCGNYTQEDLAALNGLFTQLNEIPGFPGIHAAADGDQANLTLSFLEPEAFNAAFPEVIGSEDAYGAAQFWYYTATNDIYTANIGYRTDMDPDARTSVLIEEVVNVLGLTDTTQREDSIVYQYSNDNTALSDMDLLILKLLYDPAIQCGMDAESCDAVIEQLYY